MADVDGSGQLAMDEVVINDADVAAALEAREVARTRKAEATAVFKERHAAALAEIAKLELPEGKSARVGRWRVTRSSIPGRAVSFETAPRTQIRIGLVGDD